jgi:cytochrome c biogenesis protein CcmG/thiol:disulfide interchange protein DsbE
LPLVLFVAFVALVVVGLVKPKNTDIASQMVGKPLPTFTLRPPPMANRG